MMKNMPATALDNPFAQQQKILLYVLPLIFAVSGINFPIGVLIYWLVTNLWSMGQQFYVIRRMPAPGSPAEKALQERRARRHHGTGTATAGAASDPALLAEPGTGTPDGGQRQQPKRQPKSKRNAPSTSRGPAPSGPKRAATGGPGSADPAPRGSEGERPTKGR